MRLQDKPYYTTYQDYLNTHWWKQLKKQLIYSNPQAKCFIDGKTYSLLLHHISYQHTGQEKRGRDIYILCPNCHKRAHFYKLFGIFTKRIKMKRKNLLRRLIFLRGIYVLKKKRLGLFLWYVLRYSIGH